MNAKKKYIIACVVFALATAILSFVPCYTMLWHGVFNWHIKQPEFYQGGLELIISAILMLFIRLFKKNFSAFFMFSIVFAYLCVNGVILPVLTDLVYFEIIIFIGAAFSKLLYKTNSNDMLKNLLVGIAVWGFCAIVLSLLKIGTINCLRWETFLLFCISLMIYGKNSYTTFTKKAIVFVEKNSHDFLSYFFIVILSLIFCALFAKTNTAQDYDSLWYGLRPEKVLFGDNSFYDSLGYISFVNYYPKLVELFLAPISDLGDFSFIQCANIFFLVFLVYAVKCCLNLFLCAGNSRQLLFLCLISSIPALANTSATAKPDIAGAFLCFLAFLYMAEFFKTKEVNDFIWELIALALCTGTKLTYLLWGGIIFTLSVAFVFWERRKINLKLKNGSLLLGILTIILICGIHYRTFLLTGYPLYPICLSVFEKIGFHGKEFMLSAATKGMDQNNAFGIKSLFSAIIHCMFNPASFPHIIMLWTSNIVPFSFVYALLFRKKGTLKIAYAILSVLLLFVSLYYVVSMNPADGNYFVLPIIVLAVLLFSVARVGKIEDIVFIMCGLILLVGQLPIMFVSHFSWAYGTKSLTREFIKNNFESTQRSQDILNYHGLGKINEALRSLKTNDRVLCNGDENIIFRLNSGVEPANLLAYKYKGIQNSIYSSFETFSAYVEKAGVKALIVYNDGANRDEVYKQYVAKYVSSHYVSSVVEDSKAICYFICVPEKEITIQNRYEDNWIGHNAKIFLYNRNNYNTLSFAFYNPSDLIFSETIDISINGTLVSSTPVKSGAWTVEVPIEPTQAGVSTVEIKTDYLQKDTGSDTRELALILSDVKLE